MPRCCVIVVVVSSIPGPCQRGRLGRERYGTLGPRGPQVTPEDDPGNRLRFVFRCVAEAAQHGAAVAAWGRQVSRLLGDGGSAALVLRKGGLPLELGPQSLEVDWPVLEWIINCIVGRGPGGGLSGNRKVAGSILGFFPAECHLTLTAPDELAGMADTTVDRRFRYMEKAAQFGGLECHGQQWDVQACPKVTTPCMVADVCEESFTCDWTGKTTSTHTHRCISQDLRCNGESDCLDGSDEDNCEVVNYRTDKCSTLLPIPGAEGGARGYNILTGDFTLPVLDHNYFGGQCEYVYNGEWRKFTYEALCENLSYNDEFKNFRKPYNYHIYRFMARAEGSYEYYNDAASLLEARKTHNSYNYGVTVQVAYVEVGVKGSKESEFLTNVTKHKSEDLSFIRLQSKVQTAQFKMRSSGLMLDEQMHQALKDLPEQYDVAMYFMFLNTYGTHYVTEGTMGGTMEYILVVNKTAMASSNTNGKNVASCFGGSLGIKVPIGPVTVGGSIGGQHCGKEIDLKKISDSSSKEITDVITRVKGGAVDTSQHKLVISDTESYRKWGESLQYSPALIEYEIMPIYELVRLSTAAGYLVQQQVHLRTAWDEYQLQFGACRCAPCQHNGTPVLKGTSCSCICRQGYDGPACEKTERDDKRTDGQWSCWQAWTTCQAGRKTRTRACNNPSPDRGGANCLGSTSQSQRC
ncbi:Complement component C8 alpha chain [Merluccius polli]|uniref:Complement component C8 alpha chain n=1 Tax=Merluccius polli TaxID=89951 RepID=A0AA47M9F5_MERPO|nr:Complement component C8 alpha chain [Merluccius polli]